MNLFSCGIKDALWNYSFQANYFLKKQTTHTTKKQLHSGHSQFLLRVIFFSTKEEKFCFVFKGNILKAVDLYHMLYLHGNIRKWLSAIRLNTILNSLLKLSWVMWCKTLYHLFGKGWEITGLWYNRRKSLRIVSHILFKPQAPKSAEELVDT